VKLVDERGRVVGRLASGFVPPAGMRCVVASVQAIVVWQREYSKPEYRAGICCERWEVVVPELIFVPEP
jgi:ATP-dependent DNA helicase RecQ